MTNSARGGTRASCSTNRTIYGEPVRRRTRRTEKLAYLGVNSFTNFTVNKAKQFVPCSYDGYVIGDGILFYLADQQLVFVGRNPAANWIRFHAEKSVYDVKATYDDRSPSRPMGKPVCAPSIGIRFSGLMFPK